MSEEQGRALAKELGIPFMETSAKANINVEEAFFSLARYLSLAPWFLNPIETPFPSLRVLLFVSRLFNICLYGVMLSDGFMERG